MPSTIRPAPSLEADTPPSTRPSSSLSSGSSSLGGVGGAPALSTSMDSLPTNGGTDKVEQIPTRNVGAAPKANSNAMQFVKTGPAQLYKSATKQIKLSQTSKALRKQASVKEEEEPDWQQSPHSSSLATQESVDWQENLDKWKMNRRKRNENALERVIEVKKFENEASQGRRKSKTFSEMREETSNKRGKRFNLVVHDDDNNDISGMLGMPSSDGKHPKEEEITRIIDPIRQNAPLTNTKADPLLEADNKDSKSDAGFCTGSDTGSDGLLDNISDTSSALGDKKEQQDSLEAVISSSHKQTSSITSSLTTSSISSKSTITHSSSSTKQEYTYDSAIQGYKQYAENTARKLNSSLTNLNSTSSTSNQSLRSKSPVKTPGNIGDKLDFFAKEMDRSGMTATSNSRQSVNSVVMREKSSAKVDISKRRTMFEMGSQSASTINLSNLDTVNNKLDRRRSGDMTASAGNLKNKVASFENLDYEPNKYKAVTPQRDSKFKEKLATFSSIEKEEPVVNQQKKSLEKDKNFKQKLANFNSIESTNETESFTKSNSKPLLANKSSLKSRIASFEQLDAPDTETSEALYNNSNQILSNNSSAREKSVSMESLARPLSQKHKFENKFTRGSVDTLHEENSLHSKVHHWQQNNSPSTPPTGGKEFPSSSPHLPPPPISTSSPRSSKTPRAEEPHYDDVVTSQSCRLYEEVKPAVINSDFNKPSPYEDVVQKKVCSHRLSHASSGNRSSGDSGRLKYTDDDINEVIDEVLDAPPAPSRAPEKPLVSSSLSSFETHSSKSHNGFRTSSSDVTAKPPPPKVVMLEEHEWLKATSSSPLLPPSEPPPPPPPCGGDSSEEEEGEALRGGAPPLPQWTAPPVTSPAPSDTFSETYQSSETSSRTSGRDEIRKRRSDFLGTSQYSDGVVSPSVDSLVEQQQKETDQKMMEARRSLQRTTAQALNNIEQSRNKIQPPVITPPSLQADNGSRGRYTWEDRVRDDTHTQETNLNDTDDGYGYHNKLAELEFEMIQHDRNVLRNTISSSTTVVTEKNTESVATSAIYDDVAAPKQNVYEGNHYNSHQSQPIYEHVANTVSDYEYQTPATEVPLSKPPEKPQRSFNPIYDSSIPLDTQSRAPAKKLPMPLPNEEPRYETVENRADVHLTRESRSALSATPKHRLNDGESWIKRKPQQNKDYNKHWLLQEAEQRRLEQRPSSKPEKPSNYPPNSNTFTMNTNNNNQHMNRALEPLTRSSSNNHLQDHYTPPSLPVDHQRKVSDPVNRVSDPNAWRNQATTYQPLVNGGQAPVEKAPQQERPLPDAIINSITQRVQHKSRSSSANNSSGRPSPYSGSISGSTSNLHHASHNLPPPPHIPHDNEDYHDYMNAEAINQHSQLAYNNNFNAQHQQQIYGNQVISSPPSCTSPHNNTYDHPHVSPQHSTPPASSSSSPGKEDQSLVSVSGKKKCSHCGEELGRGAAMIIESLRLFYHIPCFVCCVCGIQLGNGEAGADVRVRNHALHCQNCYSNDKGMKFSEV